MLKAKLTLVSFWFQGEKYTEFVYLKPNSRGKFVLSQEKTNKILERLGVPVGSTYTVG